jgi:hypothetical protein
VTLDRHGRLIEYRLWSEHIQRTGNDLPR